MYKVKLCLCCLMTIFVFSAAFANGTIDIAAIYAVTGQAAEGNSSSLVGVRGGVDEINKQGILGKKLRLLIFDNKSSSIGSNKAAKRAAEAGVSAIIGASWSSHSIAAAKVAQEMGIPMVSDSSTHPDVTIIGDCIFRVCFTDAFQGSVMARFARQELNAVTAVVFVDLLSDYSLTLSAIFRKNFEALGGQVVAEVEYKQTEQDFTEQVRQTKRADADVLFLSGHDESGLIIKQAKNAGISSIPIGGDGWDPMAFYSKGGSYLKRGYYCSHWSPHTDSELSRSFYNKYKYSHNFGPSSALAYDAMMLLADAIRRAGSSDRVKIRDALAKTDSFEGVTGNISFDTNGDPVKSAIIMEIKNGAPCYFMTFAP